MWKLPSFKLPRLPKQTGAFPAREWRAHIALIASIVGATAFTTLSLFLIMIIWMGGWPTETSEMRLDLLGKALMLSLSGSLVVVISFGFAINRRMIKITRTGIVASGGSEDTPHGEYRDPELDIDSEELEQPPR